MELSKRALAEVKFKTKGKWYSAEQVDFFIDELSAGLDAAENEKNALRREIQRLREEMEEAAKLRSKVNKLEMRLKEAHGLRDEIDRLEIELDRMGSLKAKVKRLERERADMETVQAENERLKAELEQSRALISGKFLARADSPAHERAVNEQLEKERGEVIEDIKMLRQLREEFKETIRNDTAEFLKSLDGMESNTIL